MFYIRAILLYRNILAFQKNSRDMSKTVYTMCEKCLRILIYIYSFLMFKNFHKHSWTKKCGYKSKILRKLKPRTLNQWDILPDGLVSVLTSPDARGGFKLRVLSISTYVYNNTWKVLCIIDGTTTKDAQDHYNNLFLST